MQISLLSQPVDDIVAKDDVDGEFFLRDGAVYYRNPSEPKMWFANNSHQHFQQCAAAFEVYCRNVSTTQDEDVVVRAFEQALTDLKALENSPCYWRVILEQCKDGLL